MMLTWSVNPEPIALTWLGPFGDTATLIRDLSTGIATAIVGPPGSEGPPASVQTWEFYAANWSVAPAQAGTTAEGAVYSYILGGVTRYRLVPTVYDSTQDAFYSSFSGGALSGLIVARG